MPGAWPPLLTAAEVSGLEELRRQQNQPVVGEGVGEPAGSKNKGPTDTQLHGGRTRGGGRPTLKPSDGGMIAQSVVG